MKKLMLRDKRILLTGSRGFLGEHLFKALSKLGSVVVRGDRIGLVPEGTDYIIDTAAYGNMYSQEDIDRTYSANFYRVLHLLNNAEKKKVQGVLLTSTSSVDLKVQTYYSASKMATQYLGLAIARS